MKYITALTLITLASCGTNNSNSEQKPEPTDIRTTIEKELINLSTFDNSIFQKDIFSLKSEVAIFLNLAILVEEAFADENPEIVKLGRELSEKVEEVQTKEFPVIRRRYSELLSTRLSLYKATAQCEGEKCESLKLTSPEFSSWDMTPRQVRSRKYFQKGIQDEVRLFRFKNISYQEKKGALSSSGYRLKSLDDNEIALLNSKPEVQFDVSFFERDLEKIKTQTQNELTGITSHLSGLEFKGDISALKLLVANYFDIAIVIDQAIRSEDPQTVELGKVLMAKLEEIQLEEFPTIRKLYTELVVNDLLRYATNVKCLDNKCESILLTSKDFNADNQVNINKRSSVMKSIEEDLKLFRFKLALYAETESTHHPLRDPIKSLDDDEIVLYGSLPEATYVENNNKN